jgi:hypothetical protein
MTKPKELYKTTMVIWTDYDPGEMDIDVLARESINGDGFCSHMGTELVTDKSLYPDTEFFNDGWGENYE